MKDYTKSIRRTSSEYKFICRFFKENGIRYRIRRDYKYSGGGIAFPSESRIEIKLGPSRNYTVRKFLSISFHEAAHIFNLREGKFVRYHRDDVNTAEDIRYFLKYWLRAELYTEWRAEKLMKQYFPDIPFQLSYDKEGIAWYRRYIVAPLKLRLAELERKNGK